jgi:L-threonylcarbamoyladenylate synthase
MKAELLATDTPERFRAAVVRAAGLLGRGEVVALPTETVYGLAANALDPSAVARIFEIKGRPAHNPVIVHVAGLDLARRCVARWTTAADRLAAAFWPGPLTLVLQKSDWIPGIITAGGSTVAVRWPAHPFMQAVIRECRFPLAAPSANLSSGVSPTRAAHVCRDLGNKVPLIVDGGASQIGIESTVLDLVAEPPRVLRPGMIHEPALQSVLGEIGPPGSDALPAVPLRSPGLLSRHYAPKARLMVLKWEDEEGLRDQLSRLMPHLGRCQVITHDRVPSARDFGGVNVVPHDPEAYGRALYAELHRCDDAGAEWIVVEAPPDGPEWRAIADRLNRASAGR